MVVVRIGVEEETGDGDEADPQTDSGRLGGRSAGFGKCNPLPGHPTPSSADPERLRIVVTGGALVVGAVFGVIVIVIIMVAGEGCEEASATDAAFFFGGNGGGQSVL